jgi:hypothetical protein
VATSAAVGAQLAVDFASGPGPTGPHPREAAWEAQLARLAAYKVAHGDCSVPYSWAEVPRLASWVNTQRVLKRRLDRGEPSEGMTAERAARLTALGFAWEPKSSSDEAAWEAQLARLAAYKAARGDCSVPHCWAEDPRLGKWVNNQRALKRKLDRGEPSEGMTAERAVRLTELGFAWEPKSSSGEGAWEAQLARLAAYKAAHGNCSVPWGLAEDPQLGRWVDKQRTYKKKLDRGEPSEGLTTARAAKLTALGFAWDPPNLRSHEAEWEAQLARLVVYKAEHGDCNVPQGWAEDPRLSNWVNNQRALKRKLDRGEPCNGMTAERAARLTALGFAFDAPSGGASLPNKAAWEAQLARLAAYQAEHGDCNVPRRWAEDPRLGNWVSHQRKLKRKLDRGEPSLGMTVERAARLMALGFAFDAPSGAGGDSRARTAEMKWAVQLARLAAYKAAHGDCNVPWRWAEDPQLGNWVRDQRAYKRKLDRGEPGLGMTGERVARLTALGFIWEPGANGPEEFSCRNCGRPCETTTALANHARTCDGQQHDWQDWRCEWCGKFASGARGEQRRRGPSGSGTLCNICGNRFHRGHGRVGTTATAGSFRRGLH